MTYRSATLHKIQIICLLDEVETRLSSHLKSGAAFHQQLTLLDFEELLGLSDNTPQTKLKVGESLLSSWNEARGQFESWKKAKNITTSDELRKMMKSCYPKLVLCDSTFRVEVAVSDQLSGPACETRTKLLCVGYMPTAQKEMKAEEVLAQFSALVAKKGFKFSPREVRAAVTSCVEWLQYLVAGHEIRLTAARMTPIAQEVSARMQFFLRYKAVNAAATLVGQTALDAMIAEFLEEDKAGKSSMTGFGKKIGQFKYLIRPEMKAQVIAALDRCQERQKSASKIVNAVTAGSSAKKGGEVKKKADKAMQEAATFFD